MEEYGDMLECIISDSYSAFNSICLHELNKTNVKQC